MSSKAIGYFLYLALSPTTLSYDNFISFATQYKSKLDRVDEAFKFGQYLGQVLRDAYSPDGYYVKDCNLFISKRRYKDLELKDIGTLLRPRKRFTKIADACFNEMRVYLEGFKKEQCTYDLFIWAVLTTIPYIINELAHDRKDGLAERACDLIVRKTKRSIEYTLIRLDTTKELIEYITGKGLYNIIQAFSVDTDEKKKVLQFLKGKQVNMLVPEEKQIL